MTRVDTIPFLLAETLKDVGLTYERDFKSLWVTLYTL